LKYPLLALIDLVFFAVGRITEEQYNELMDINKEEEPKAENN
jgi:hypothetical protein